MDQTEKAVHFHVELFMTKMSSLPRKPTRAIHDKSTHEKIPSETLLSLIVIVVLFEDAA